MSEIDLPVEVRLPSNDEMGESCTVTAWLAHSGDYVRAGQTIARIETAFAEFELAAPASGFLRVIVAADRGVPNPSVLATIEETKLAALTPQEPAAELSEPVLSGGAGDAPTEAARPDAGTLVQADAQPAARASLPQAPPGEEPRALIEPAVELPETVPPGVSELPRAAPLMPDVPSAVPAPIEPLPAIPAITASAPVPESVVEIPRLHSTGAAVAESREGTETQRDDGVAETQAAGAAGSPGAGAAEGPADEPTAAPAAAPPPRRLATWLERDGAAAEPAQHQGTPGAPARAPIVSAIPQPVAPPQPRRQVSSSTVPGLERSRPERPPSPPPLPLMMMVEADATELALLQQRLSPRVVAAAGCELPLEALLARIVAHALAETPSLNARMGERGPAPAETVDLAVAVRSPRGLLFPVVVDAARKDIETLAREVVRNVERAGLGAITAADCANPTFSLISMGSLGIDAFTPALCPPAVASLGVGRIVSRPAVCRGHVAIRQMVTLSLSYDSRAVDGLAAARLLSRVSSMVQAADLGT